MSINYPTSLDTLTNPVAGNALNSPDHATQHANANDAIEALEAKVGANSSAVTTSHDYKLSAVTGSAKALTSGTSTQSVTGLTLVSPTLTLTSDATGDIYYRNSGGALTRLPIGTTGQILDVSSGGIPEWVANPAAADASTTAKGTVEIATQAEADAGTAAGGTTSPLVTRTSNIRAKNYNDYVADTGSANAIAIAPSPAITAYATAQYFTFKANATNTGATTINVNSLGTKNVYSGGAACTGGEIVSGVVYSVCYDGTQFHLISPTTSHTSTSGVSDGPATTSTQTITHGLGRVPKIVRLTGYCPQAGGVSTGVYDSSGNRRVNRIVAGGAITVQTDTTSAIRLYDDQATDGDAIGVVQNLTATSFDIAWTVATGTAATCKFIWEAQ